MAQLTTNLKLTKPELTDNITPTIFAENFDTIDEAFGGCTLSVDGDGAYVTYTPTGGADPVTKKLGSMDASVILDSLTSTYKNTAGTNAASNSATLEADSTYLIIAVSYGSVAYAYNGNSYGGTNWAFTNTTLSFSSGTATKIKEQTVAYMTKNGAISYVVYSVVTGESNATVTASANCNNTSSGSAANDGSTVQTLFTIKIA